MEIIAAPNTALAAGKALTELLLAQQERPVLLAVSGGSAFSLLEFVDPAALNSQLTLTVLDERFSLDPAVNNFTQLEQTKFYAFCASKKVAVIPTKVQAGESLQDLAARFGNALRTWKKQHTQGVIIATMGIGLDGHTAGIFPSQSEVDFNGDAWVAGYSLPKEMDPHRERVTVTYTFLRNYIDSAVVYAVGSDKYRLVQRLRETRAWTPAMPMTILKEMRAVTIFTSPL